jgi:hypothetical protein
MKTFLRFTPEASLEKNCFVQENAQIGILGLTAGYHRNNLA